MPFSLARRPRPLALGGATLLALWLACAPAQAALDVDALWDYSQPARSEQAFRAALPNASPDEQLSLLTQVARTFTLRGEFGEAERELDALEPRLAGAGVEPRVRALLERGRILKAQGHPPRARPLFVQAMELARPAGLETLTADAMQAVASVEPSAEGRLAWQERTADFAREAKDPRARKWEAAALNNMGITLIQMGRPELALPVLRKAQVAYEQQGLAPAVRGSRWMIAHAQRLSGDLQGALAGFEALERDDRAAGQADRYVFNELASVHEALGQADKAEAYLKKSQAVAR